MSFFSRVVRFLFWLLVLSWGVKLLRYVLAWTMRRATGPPAREGVDVAGTSEAVGLARRLVRDPVCGVHVAEVLAIPLREGTATLHFCSIACRDQYASSGHHVANQLAANG
jgi:YHS domain-containing protein